MKCLKVKLYLFFQSILTFLNTRGIYEKLNNNKYEVLVQKKGITVTVLLSTTYTNTIIALVNICLVIGYLMKNCCVFSKIMKKNKA